MVRTLLTQDTITLRETNLSIETMKHNETFFVFRYFQKTVWGLLGIEEIVLPWLAQAFMKHVGSNEKTIEHGTSKK